MIITLAVDEQVAERARQAAQAMGKSLNQAVREYLERLGGEQQRIAAAEAYKKSALASPYQLKGWRFNRDEINERS
ncbi:MAG: DUF6364 family protein [Burkholderiales bacterium]